MRRAQIDEATAHEAAEIVQMAEAYVREVARRSHQSAQQVEPVIQATLATLLEQMASDDWGRSYRQFRDTLAHDARLRESYAHAGNRRSQVLSDLLRHYLSRGSHPAFYRADQDERAGTTSEHLLQQGRPASDQLSIDLVATIAGTGLLLMESKSWLDEDLESNVVSAQQLVSLERENVLRVFDGWQELLGRSVGGPEVAKRLGVSRQRLNALRREDRLLGLKVPIRRELHYPVWQFGEDGQPLPAMPQLLLAAREAGLHPRDLDALMVSTDAGEGKTLIEYLRAGDEAYVLGVIRAAGE